MTILNTAYGGVLNASDLNDQAKAILSMRLDQGKGVVSGMEVAPGSGLTLVVQPGRYSAQVPDKLPSAQTVPVPPNYDGYLWVEANSADDDVPAFDTQGTADDYGSDWVCLGHFVSTGSAVAYDPAGRTKYGYLALANSVDHVVDAKVASMDLATMDDVRDYTENWWVDVFNGDGATKSFALTYPPIKGSLRITVQPATSIGGGLSGQSVAFTSAPAMGATVSVQYTYLPS